MNDDAIAIDIRFIVPDNDAGPDMTRVVALPLKLRRGGVNALKERQVCLLALR